MLYAAIFIPHEDGKTYSVVFPDFPGCVTQDEGLEKTVLCAEEALGLHLSGMRDAGLPIPGQSDMEAARKECGESPGAFLVMVKPEEDMEDVVMVKPEEKEKPVQLTISIKPSALKTIDRAAEDIGISRSGFLLIAAKHYIREAGI